MVTHTYAHTSSNHTHETQYTNVYTLNDYYYYANKTTHTHTHTYTYTYIHTHIHIHTHTHPSNHTHTYIYSHTHESTICKNILHSIKQFIICQQQHAHTHT